MKCHKVTLFFAFLFFVFCFLFSVDAAIPHLINYQGRLTDSGGTPLNGSYSLTFRIYDAESGGTLLWQETQTVSIQKGIFNVLLGSITNLDLAFDKPYFLEIKVDDEVMSPRQRITSAGYAIRAEDTERLEGQTGSYYRNADTLDTHDTATSSGASKIYVSDASGYLPDATVDTTALKTTTGEVNSTGTDEVMLILPGGTYGFYPQIKGSDTNAHFTATIGGRSYQAWGSTYKTYICLQGGRGSTAYAQQRYVTASGEDYWLFLLIDKQTKEIISAYSATDHPAYGNGGNFDKLPHPFGNYDERKHEIVLVDNDTIAELKAQVTPEKSLLTLVNENYKPKMDNQEVYKPLHSGKFLTENKDGKQVQVKQMVKTIPNYIKVRKLLPLTAEEKIEKENKRQLVIQKAEQNTK